MMNDILAVGGDRENFMQRFKVRSRRSSYEVVIGRGAWRALREFSCERYTSIFVVTERRLWRLWGETFLKEAALAAELLFVTPGEASKSLAVLGRLAGQLLKRGADRRSLLVLFGGGVIGDLGGFLASVYMRGVDCVHVPTTVLAQVDSSIGGKTAVNLTEMKNLIGTFYPPRAVVSDARVLSSLSGRDFRSGLYEVVKHAILDGAGFVSRLEACAGTLRPDADVAALESVIAQAAMVKINVVNRDEREAGLRMALNLGHTFGHALEEVTHYKRFLHGEAVAWGLLAVSRLAQRMGVLKPPEGERMERLVWSLGPLPPVRDISPSSVLRLLPQDKKTVAGKIQWVVPERMGKVRITSDVPARVAEVAFRDIQRMN